MNLVRLLEESAKKFSWRKCLIFAGGNLSFSGLNTKSSQLARGLKEKLNIRQGDRVAILLENSPQFIISLFAILKARAVCVPLNVFLSPRELNYILKDSQARLLISSSSFSKTLQQLSLKDIILTDKKEDNLLYWSEITHREQIKNLSEEVNTTDLAILIYTSGTTGFPKGVMLTHGNLSSNVIASVQALEITSRDRFLLILPMFHSFTLTVCILVPLYIGARIVILKSLRPFRQALRSIFLNRISVIAGIPQLFDVLKNLKLSPFLQRFLGVRICISGAAPLTADTLRAFNARFRGIALLEGYGLSEASPVVSLNPLRGERKEGSIGLPIPGIETKVVGDDESELACGQIGELIVKGPNVMLGYLNLPEETKKTIKGGWLFTGDMAKIDSDGYIYIVGRKKEMILTHGMNIYPSEIENMLSLNPKVKETAVVGKKDQFKGEVPVAFIVLKEGCTASEAEIINYCKEKIANYKIPRLIEFRDNLPKTPTGKILKRKLTEAFSES